uniref:Heme-binding protein HMX1 n=1 Tax=Talaromyces marneffei PM1 TaxID=1077442 RepID=A0A093VGR6_TALMA
MSSSSASPASSPDEAHSTLESGTVTNGVKSVDSVNTNGNDIDLPTRIQAASRAIHHTLHHAVVGRLPLALPPQTTSPHLYTLGISRFSRIYFTFETAWRDYLSTSPTDHDPNSDQIRYHALLSEAYIPAITRSERLASDISSLEREWADNTPSAVQPADHDAALRDAVAHITETAQRKPYALLAYSWIMYMALFNGGRWIRDQLVNAGPQFWLREESEKADSLISPSFLSFWSFDGDEDGEDINALFELGSSKRLANISPRLSARM